MDHLWAGGPKGQEVEAAAICGKREGKAIRGTAPTCSAPGSSGGGWGGPPRVPPGRGQGVALRRPRGATCPAATRHSPARPRAQGSVPTAPVRAPPRPERTLSGVALSPGTRPAPPRPSAPSPPLLSAPRPLPGPDPTRPQPICH
jgi:hypothetical protein